MSVANPTKSSPDPSFTHPTELARRVLMVCPELPSADNPGSMAPAARQIESLRPHGVDPTIVDMRGIPRLKYLQAIPKVRRSARSVDLVHAHFGFCGWLAYLAQWPNLAKTPLVISFMGDDLLGTPSNEVGDLEWFSKVMVGWNVRLSRKAIAVITKSREMADLLPVDATVIPNGVDTTLFQPMERSESCKRLDADASVTRILFAGDPGNPRKRFGLATRAVEVARQLTGSTIELIPMWNVKPDDVPVLMNSCDAMLMTSLIEGSPNVVKEAMACDLPVVGVPVGDVHELLDGVSGSSRSSDAPEDIGRHLARLLTERPPINSREIVLSRGLDLDSVAKRIVKIYDRLLNG